MRKSIKFLLILGILLVFSSVALATEIPGGRYKVGEDIPEGCYTISNIKRGTNLTVWGAEYDDYKAAGGLLLNVVVNDKNPCLGKVVLVKGNVIDFTAALDFTKYEGLEFDPESTNTVYGGRYTVGEDIPAGSYSISATDRGTNLTVWGAAYDDYKTNGGLLLNVVMNKDRNPNLGKVILEEGNVIDFSSPLIFEPYKGFSFD